MAAIIAEGAVLQTRTGYVHVENYDNETPILTEKGFKNVVVEPIDYHGQCVQLILWGFPDWIYIASDSVGVGTTYEKCLDLGGLGLCRPFNRCWKECPDNHPFKLHFQNPKELTFREIRKRSDVIIPTTCKMTYHHSDAKKAIKKFYDAGFQFSRDYKTCPEDIPCIDLEYNLYSDPLEFKSFMLGWYDSAAQSKFDMWNYFLILKNKELAYQLQFLFNYFGVPCAMEPYHSNIHGTDNWAVVWCKNKRFFHYKIFLYNKQLRSQVKKWTPFTTEDELILPKKWFKISRGEGNDAEYFAAPFYFKY